MCQIMRGGITKPLTSLDFAKHNIIFSSDQTISWIARKTERTRQERASAVQQMKEACRAAGGVA